MYSPSSSTGANYFPSMDPYQSDMRGSGPSEDDGDPNSALKTKRGSRACDRCRKIKSKCEPTDGERCRNCLAAGTPCTYQGPSFKRGPPKGYIHAIEQRWHQVECILGTIMASPRASGIVNDLRQDPFARDVLDRVDTGPYGPTGRASQHGATSREGFYDAIMGSAEATAKPVGDDRRSRRQSRLTREIVSTQEHAQAVPTPEWQNQLLQRLVQSHSQMGSQMGSGVASPYLSSPASSIGMPTSTLSPLEGAPPRQRLRMEGPSTGYASEYRRYDSQPSEAYSEDLRHTVDALGHLSVNENKDIRYHDRAAGLHLLARSDRNDDSHTNENGIWKFQRTSSSTTSSEKSTTLAEEPISLPEVYMQDHLIHLYFTYVHIFLPVIHKRQFLAIYDAYSKFGSVDSAFHSGYVLNAPFRSSRSPGVEGAPGNSDPFVHGNSIQGVSKLLLLAMFAFAARYDHFSSNSGGRTSKAGHQYAAEARRVLNEVYQHSRPSTCQALLLMGIREFGIGSMEQGWLFIGMASRMAVDLGMNHDADHWKTAKGAPVFSVEDRAARKRIWWACCIADKLSSVWLGRPVNFREGDFNVLWPEIEYEEEHDKWEPYPADAFGPDFTSEACRILSCYQEQAKLSFIISQIMAEIYPVRTPKDTHRRSSLEKLEQSLHQWLFHLPEHLAYCETSKRVTPLPHVLALHIEYQSALLLLHRAFIPSWDDPHAFSDNRGGDPLALKAFDKCQGAATHIASFVTIYDQKYGLNRCPPLLSVYLQSAGIMHVVTLNVRPGNTQASIGLIQCIDAARAIEETWPCAIQIRQLLQGCKVYLDPVLSTGEVNRPDRHKRDIDQALGTDRPSEMLQREVFGDPSVLRHQPYIPDSHQSRDDEAARIMAHSLGIPLPGIQPSTSYYPGYEWWHPSVMGGQQHLPYTQHAEHPPTRSYQPSPQPTQLGSIQGHAPQGPFTFDNQQLSSEFVQGASGSQTNQPGMGYGRYSGSGGAGPSHSHTHPHPQ
ncbi:hypothetical protein QCA50_002364 [Cerrena zonata]|uniref:Zn(2)-C6 fungal-type domain-containing protein n=1 Tax=Cerrena zonata TaxID=2478898 RepID=A0AAW0GTG7_9APHY